MSVVIGMDEAGYGPNLGPLLISASVWSVPDQDPRQFDFWGALAESVSQHATSDGRLYVADSKAVYTAQRGLKDLERGVLAILGLNENRPQTFIELVRRVAGDDLQMDVEPWFRDVDLTLPVEADAGHIDAATERLRSDLARHDVSLQALRSDVVLTARFNQVVSQFNNKASAHASFVFDLLSRVWKLHERTLVIGDKLGGRNRYDDLIADIPGVDMVFRQEESGLISRYRVGSSELRFQQKAEQHFPVAVASMVCKYVRELSMELFNRFWQQHLPDIKPTKGYPEDAKRFRQAIDELRTSLGIDDETFWRSR